jgi:DNA polymerase III delta prime subunit
MSDVVVRPWYLKYRPTIDNYIWPNNEIKAVVFSWLKEKSIPNLMLAGIPGTGKTSLAEIIIRTLNIDDSDLLLLNGINDNSVETVRNDIKSFCELGGWSGLRIVFFDEADYLSNAAQGALRTIIDEYSDTVRFILTCNYPHRIMDAIGCSRLIRIDFDKLDTDAFLEYLLTVLVKENVEVDNDNISIVYNIQERCYPDMRKALNELQASVIDGKLLLSHRISSSTGEWGKYLKEAFVNKVNPLAELLNIRNMLATVSPDEMENIYYFLYHNGGELFGDQQIRAIYTINDGQTKHRNALLPDFILLEVILRLLTLIRENNN